MVTRTVHTASGILTGVETDGIVHARGIPYAHADRFGKPVPVDSPTIPRDATRRGPACPQAPSRLDGVTGPMVDELEQDEHCLVLSVAAPVAARAAPVMVWFHGGAYVTGGGEAPKYDPEPLVRDGVVVVNVTSRLGGFGYLTPVGSPAANLGLQDQILALRWVSAGIAAFGGDPANVTVFGQSAGGDAIVSMMACPAANGLFHRAIVQSAPLGLRRGRSRCHEAARAAFTDGLTGDPTTAPASAVLAAARAVDDAVRSYGMAGRMPFGPVFGVAPFGPDVDGALRDSATRVELLIGRTEDDAEPFVRDVPAIARLRSLGPVGRAVARRIVAAVTRKVFGTSEIERVWSTAGGRIATYRLAWAPANAPFGATHCIELPLLFGGDWSDAPMLAGERTPDELAAAVRHTWTTFATVGAAGLPRERIVFS